MRYLFHYHDDFTSQSCYQLDLIHYYYSIATTVSNYCVVVAISVARMIIFASKLMFELCDAVAYYFSSVSIAKLAPLLMSSSLAALFPSLTVN